MAANHDLNNFVKKQDDKARSTSHGAAERALIGNRRHNIAGVARGGALQAKRLGGTYNSAAVSPGAPNPVVGP